MQLIHRIVICIMLVACAGVAWATTSVVSNVTAHQRTNGSMIVDIYYDLAYSGTSSLTVSVVVSSDDGITYTIHPSKLTGAVGSSVSKGSGKHIEWCSCSKDLPGAYGSKYRVAVVATDGAVVPEVTSEMLGTVGLLFLLGLMGLRRQVAEGSA